MFGIDFTLLDAVFFVAAVITTFYVSIRANPYTPGTEDHLCVRLTRTAIALLLWAYPLGLFGVLLTITAFAMGVAVAIKGQVSRGVFIIVAVVVISGIGLVDGLIGQAL